MHLRMRPVTDSQDAKAHVSFKVLLNAQMSTKLDDSKWKMFLITSSIDCKNRILIGCIGKSSGHLRNVQGLLTHPVGEFMRLIVAFRQLFTFHNMKTAKNFTQS